MNDPTTIARYRMRAEDFTRKRQLSFQRVATLIVRGHGLANQTAINRLYHELNEVEHVVSESAYRQARRKLKPELFSYLSQLVVEQFYQPEPSELRQQQVAVDPDVRMFAGRRLVAVDIAMLNLPDTPALRERFGVQSNQSEQSVVQAAASLSYDVLNNIALSAALDRRQSARSTLLEHHLATTQAGDILVLDREFGDYSVLASLLESQRDFVIRLQTNSFLAAQQFSASEATDACVEITLTGKQRRFVRQQGLSERLSVRLVKIQLGNGTTEVLATSLLDAEQYPSSMLKTLYGSRWGIETYFDRLKNIFELERFSGSSLLAIEQDFHGIVFLTTLESVLSHSVDSQLSEHSRTAECKYPKRVNHAVSYAALLDTVTELLINPRRTTQQVLDELHILLRMNPVLERPDRRYPRQRPSPAKFVRHYKYRRRRPA